MSVAMVSTVDNIMSVATVLGISSYVHLPLLLPYLLPLLCQVFLGHPLFLLHLGFHVSSDSGSV